VQRDPISAAELNLGVPLVDIGVNLLSRQFGKDALEVIERSRVAGVSTLVLTACSLRDARGLQDEFVSHGEVHGVRLVQTVGVHPHNAKQWSDETRKDLRSLLRLPGVAAVGECGLDYDRNFSPPELQRKCFRDQVDIANESGLPLLLHVRGPPGAEEECYRDFVEILKAKETDVRACFTGSAEQAKLLLSKIPDLYFGITGWICDERRGGEDLALVARDVIPRNRMMIETDAPFLLPRLQHKALKGRRRNEPAFLPLIAEKLAQTMKVSAQDLALLTTSNARRFFSLDAPPRCQEHQPQQKGSLKQEGVKSLEDSQQQESKEGRESLTLERGEDPGPLCSATAAEGQTVGPGSE